MRRLEIRRTIINGPQPTPYLLCKISTDAVETKEKCVKTAHKTPPTSPTPDNGENIRSEQRQNKMTADDDD